MACPPSPSRKEMEIAEKIVEVQHEMDALEDAYNEKTEKVYEKMWSELAPAFKERVELIARDFGNAGNFWWKAFTNAQSPMYDHVDPNDERIFRAVTHLHVERTPEGMKVLMTLSPNPFVTNTELWRVGRCTEGKPSTVSGTNWKPGSEKIAKSSFLNFFSLDMQQGQESEIFSALVDDVFLDPLRYVS